MTAYAIKASRGSEVFWWDGWTFAESNVPKLFLTIGEANLELFPAMGARNIQNVVISVVKQEPISPNPGQEGILT